METNIGPAYLSAALNFLEAEQRKLGYYFPGWAEGEPEFVRTTFLALIKEVAELMDWFDWKPWKVGPVGYTEGGKLEAAEEFADVLAFLGYIVLFLDKRGIQPSALAAAYVRKTAVNHRRLGGLIPGFASPRGGKHDKG